MSLLPDLPNYQDGDYTTPVAIARTPYAYPFAALGDVTTKTYTRTYLVDGRGYTPMTPGTVDPDLAAHYLITEEPLEWTRGPIATLRRTFASIPTQQIEYTSVPFTKPVIPGANDDATQWTYLDNLIYQPDSLVPRFRIFGKTTVVADSGFSIYVTGGTYTLTFEGDTTSALAYNAAAATVESAINGLASLADYGTVSVSGSYTAGFTITFSNYATASATLSLTGPDSAGFNSYTGVSSGGRRQDVSLAGFGNLGNPSHTVNTGGLSNFTTVGVNTDYYYNTTRRTRQTRASSTLPTGTYTLTYFGETTAAISTTATEAEVLAAINALNAVTVRGGVIFDPAQSQKFWSLYAGNYSLWINLIWGNPTATAGTFTLTVLGDTTGSLAYDASAATIETAINGLTNVTAVGGVTVTGTSAAFTIEFAATPSLTANSASLTPSPSIVSIGVSDYGDVQAFSLTTENTSRTITAIDHGLTEGGGCYALIGGTYYYDWPFFVLSGDQITVDTARAPFNTANAVTEIGAYKRTYSPGGDRLRARRIMDYYLPGVSSGITTALDIPISEPQLEPEAFFEALFAGETWAVYDSRDLSRWLEGPIYMTDITSIYLPDV